MKAPFPYFGGKSAIASAVWQALGNVGHYIEPFCGSCAVLLARPQYDPTRHVETVNDADGMIANVWRSLQQNPEEVAKWCDWPVNHVDLIARKKRLNAEYHALLERLCADDTYCCPKLAGYYIWAASCWIGHGLIYTNERPHLGDAGMGVHAKGKIPHLADAGQGIHAKGNIPSSQTANSVQDPYNSSIYHWFRQLSQRLRYVRVVCGDWSRVCGGNWQTKAGRPCGVFFDPPYGQDANRGKRLYAVDDLSIASQVREWCQNRASDSNYRIVLAGYVEEHHSLLDEGWTALRWTANRGYAKPETNQNRFREALFCSPHCLKDRTLF